MKTLHSHTSAEYTSTTGNYKEFRNL